MGNHTYKHYALYCLLLLQASFSFIFCMQTEVELFRTETDSSITYRYKKPGYGTTRVGYFKQKKSFYGIHDSENTHDIYPLSLAQAQEAFKRYETYFLKETKNNFYT